MKNDFKILKKVKQLLPFIVAVLVFFTSCQIETANLLNFDSLKKQEMDTNSDDTILVVQPSTNPCETKNTELADKLCKELGSLLSNKAGNWSIYVKNLDTGLTLEMNEKKVSAASLIKLFNMVTFYHEVLNESLEMTDSLHENVTYMITESSNDDSNEVVTAIGNGDFSVGAKKVTDFAIELGCTNTQEEHMLFSTDRNISGKNRTSVKDCGIILEKIYQNECVSPEYDKEMLNLLKRQERNHKLPVGLPQGTVIAHKTGENSKVEADVGIVFAPSCDYIICVAGTDFELGNPYQTIADISTCVYDFFERTSSEYPVEK